MFLRFLSKLRSFSVLLLAMFIFVGQAALMPSSDASLRHKCNCRIVKVEKWEPEKGRRTTWGRLKVKKPHIVEEEKCDTVWLWNPFYHKGACD